MVKKLDYVEYIWLDGASPTQELRSKTRMLFHQDNRDLSSFPDWSFDGSSTWQALGRNSDCILTPVFFAPDPIRGAGNYIVLCEVFNHDDTPHSTNRRAELRSLMDKVVKYEPYIGFEQEYTLLKGSGAERWPLGWPQGGYPPPQGAFYCGIGAGKVYGRVVVEEHAKCCEFAGLNIYGVNAEVMPAQWEFQIGYRKEGERADPLTMSDHIWVARYLINRIAEKYGISVSFENKPIKGDWNGAGMHANFSTKKMRDPKGGKVAIADAIKKLEEKHEEHITQYGYGLKGRLTGLHETCHISEFKSGVSNRGASIRIPISTDKNGCGYIEDRRPGANADPYIVSKAMLTTVCL